MALDPKIRKSREQERRGAKLHGGTRNSGSGNTPWRKNDVRVADSWLIEYKRTDKNSITIQASDLEDVRTNALLEARLPAMGIELHGRDWTLIETAEFERLRSGCAGGAELVSGELRGRSGQDVSTDRAGAQEDPGGRQARLSRARRSRSMPGEGVLP